MVIKDLRKEKFIQIDVKTILERIIENTPDNLLNGLNRIVILDTDYRKTAIGRHRHMKDGSYEIEIMMDNFDIVPQELLEEDMINTLQISLVFFHELYHHKNGIYNKKPLKKEKDEKLADVFGKKMTKEIMNKIYSKDEGKAIKAKVAELQKVYVN